MLSYPERGSGERVEPDGLYRVRAEDLILYTWNMYRDVD